MEDMRTPWFCRPTRIAVVALAALVVAGCGSESGLTGTPTSPITSSPSGITGSSSTIQTVAGSDATTGGANKVLVVIEENHTEAAALRKMPYLASLAQTYGRTTAYEAVEHPSLPNYLAIAGGSTFGITDDANPAAHPLTGPSVFDAALAAGKTAKTYAEAMPAPCALRSVGTYAVRHNPWTYFADPESRTNCARFDVPAGTPTNGPLRDDIDAGALPTVGMLIPDLCNDAHDCSLAVADEWLHEWIPAIMGGPDYRSGALTIVVTFDEDDHSGGNRVLTTVISPAVSAVVTDAALTHFSLSRLLTEAAGAPSLRSAADAPSMSAAFGW